MSRTFWSKEPTIGILAGWQFYRTATNLSYLKPLFNGINKAAQSLNCNVFFGCGMGASATAEDPIRPAWPIAAADVDFVPINLKNTDGLIVFNPLHSATRSQFIQSIIREKHPVLFVGSGESGPNIVADNFKGIDDAIQHLIDHGHRQIAFLAGSPEDMTGDTGERLNAYYSCIERNGLDCDPRRVAFGRHVFDGGYDATHQIINSQVEFTAILSSNDEMALGAMKALQERGYRIPQDVAIIGFDNRLEGTVANPPLSSVHVPLFTIGQQSLELLVNHIRGIKNLPMLTKIPTHLIIRETCGCSSKRNLIAKEELSLTSLTANQTEDWLSLCQPISRTILNQTQSLGENECNSLCQSLIHAFQTSLKEDDPEEFLRVFLGILQQSLTREDPISIWQDALDILSHEADSKLRSSMDSGLIQRMFNEARKLVVGFMQRQYQQYLAYQIWTSSRLSLLSASLTTALGQKEIFKTLEKHLPEMGIKFAKIVLFNQTNKEEATVSTLWNVLDLNHVPINFPSDDFPPQGVFEEETATSISLIPLVHQSIQLGYAVFGADKFDLYGSIVQQVAGALNTARLHHQAVEGRRPAEEANRMKSRFLSTISHELRTPINLIVGLSSMLIRQNDEGDSNIPEFARQDIDRIHAYAQHLGGLIGDVVDLAVSDAGQLRLNYEVVDLAPILRLISETGSLLAMEKGLTWEAHFPESGPLVWGDQTRLRQVVLNLINNAIKFTSAGGITLRVEECLDSVAISVQDTGIGIPVEEQSTIFDEFRQSERSKAKGYGGLGLGLAICKRIVDLHHGDLTLVSSGEEGNGSTFTFTLPILHPHSDSTIKLEKLIQVEPRVLILTNHEKKIDALFESLVKRNIEVKIESIQYVRDLVSETSNPLPETIILDVSTDPALGWQALRDIKANKVLSGIPVMFFSTSQVDESLLELNYLTKPTEISELTKALDQHWLLANSGRSICNVLVVDDEPATLDMHTRIVQEHSSSNKVFKARNGKEALSLMQREIVDLVLLDLQMPEMDGFEVLEAMQAKETTRKIPVIVVTGKVLNEVELERLSQGVTAVLAKGVFSSEETIGHINRALEQKRRISVEAKRLVRSAMVYLHENFAQSISRQDIAKHIGVSEDHMTFCFRQELGVTPNLYLQRYRINQAKRMLKETDQSITSIAFSVGFSDSGYFSRIFRRETGMSPEKFRHSQ
jgi:signal transduction histidine kinase/DNA-binding LacI/PurR family transcriptional regulator/CheY-like chemotaxis protein